MMSSLVRVKGHGIWIGTFGWTYASWRGPFYAPEIRDQCIFLLYAVRRSSARLARTNAPRVRESTQGQASCGVAFDDRMVDNFFAEIGKFCTRNVPPGIDLSNDPLLQQLGGPYPPPDQCATVPSAHFPPTEAPHLFALSEPLVSRLPMQDRGGRSENCVMSYDHENDSRGTGQWQALKPWKCERQRYGCRAEQAHD
jgi:hypothetical protein